MRILELKEGQYHLAREDDRYYLAMPDHYVIKLKPREIKDYLRWGTQALDELSKVLSNDDARRESRNLAGVDLSYALHRHRVENGLSVMVERDGFHVWEVVARESLVPDAAEPMRCLIRNRQQRWAFFQIGEGYRSRCFLSVFCGFGAAGDLTVRFELAPEEVAAWHALGRPWLEEFVRHCQTASSDPMSRRLDAALAEAMDAAEWAQPETDAPASPASRVMPPPRRVRARQLRPRQPPP